MKSETVEICPKTGKKLYSQCRSNWPQILLPISGVLDWDQPSPEVKDAFQQFAPEGLATIVMDLHGNGGKLPQPQVWKGMPVMELINNACNFAGAEQTAQIMAAAIKERGNKVPGFHFFRMVW